MKQLLLLRHAHAEDAGEGQADIDRPLSPRGRAEALDAAHCIAAAGLRCDQLLVSPAVRTRETATIVAAELDLARKLQFEDALYPGEPDALLAAVRRCPAGSDTVLLVGHNPGLSEFAQRFKGTAPPVELQKAGLCAVSFGADTSWSGLRPGQATGFTLLR